MSNTKYILRAVVFALAGSVLVFLLVGMILADRWQVVTTRSIPATVEVIRAKVTDLRAWPDWSALDFRLGNPTEQEVTGVAGTSGQVLTWRGPMGVAMLELTTVEQAHVDYTINYKYGPDEQSFGGRFTGTIDWQASEGATSITWTENGELDNLIQRWSNWFGALQDKVKQVQGSSLAGLAENLRRAEDRAAGDANKSAPK